MTGPPPPYGAYPPPGAYASYDGYPQPQPTNALAIVSLVCAFLFAPLGIIFGHISLSQIKKTGEEGRGLAVAGLVISYLITVLTVVLVLLSVLFFVKVAGDLASLDRLTPSHPDITSTPSPQTNNTLPPFDPPKTLGSNCQYPATTEQASKPVKPPQNGRIATDPALIRASIAISQGTVGLELDEQTDGLDTLLMGVGGGVFKAPPENLTPTLATPQAAQSGEWYANLLMKYGPDGLLSYSDDQAMRSQMSGRANIRTQSITWMVPLAKHAESTVQKTVRYGLMPAGPAGNFSGCNSHGLGIPAGSKKKDLIE